MHPQTIKGVIFMRKAVLYPTFATLLILITAGTIMFFRKDKTAEQVRKSYDKYMAQLAEVTVDNVSLEIITEGSDLESNAKEYAFFEKAEQARNYLLKHAPELLPVEKSVSEMDNEYIERLRKLNPEAAEREKARRAENRRKIKAASDAQLAAFEKEAAALKKEIKADKARFKVAAETRKQERAQRQIEKAEREARFEKLREQLIFDDNGAPIGIKNPLSFPTAPSERSDPPPTPSENQIIPLQPPLPTQKR
jgi:hypothetical protein